MRDAPDWLPPLVTLEEQGGDWERFYRVVYALFYQDWVISKPAYRGKRMALKKHPLIDGKEYTFYHLTHDGDIETERLPNLRRMERIRWPRALIEAIPTGRVNVWRTERHTRSGRKDRILIALSNYSYLVVLEERGDYVLLWTAYTVERQHQRDKLRNEYEAYKEAETAQ